MDHNLKDIAKIDIAAFSDKGTVRGNNEDNLFSNTVDITNRNSADLFKREISIEYSNEAMIFAVFDGIGGTYGGEIASFHAARVFSDMSDEIAETEMKDFPSVLEKLKDRIEKNILVEEGFTTKNMPGTTCCAFLLREGKVLPFWIGDSRIYMLRGNRLILLTKDHTIAQEKIDYGVISPEEATSISGWHHLTAYVGDLHSKFAIGTEFELEAGDRFLLCSDGISDKFSASEIANYMNNGIETCLDLFEKEVSDESKDNATALLIEFRKSELHSLRDAIKKRTKECVDVVISSAKNLE
ncbi:MAG: serine/threonine-protein phosphatase [Lachnospiraceae bacterium]|nr:serine/threonine-protein phosphatase [Lachnospiraceae bacterium]